MAAALLKNGRIKMKGLFSEKKGVLYDAVVVLADTGDKYVNYQNRAARPVKIRMERSNLWLM